LYSSLCCVCARDDKRGQKRRNGFPAGNQQLLFHSICDSRVVMWYKELQSPFFMCTLYIGDILVSKKAMLPNPCYHESEVFLYNPAVHDTRDLQLSSILNFLFYTHSCIECTSMILTFLTSFFYHPSPIITISLFIILLIFVFCLSPLMIENMAFVIYFKLISLWIFHSCIQMYFDQPLSFSSNSPFKFIYF
jgi:hypothetical protein